MKTAIRDENPVVIFEDKLMYNDKAPGAGGGISDPLWRGQYSA